MRLTRQEIGSIKECAGKHFGSNCVVTLFGSRVDDAKRGGDIDLHVRVDEDGLADLRHRIRYLADLEGRLGERKVDLVIEGPRRKNGYIDQAVRETGIVL